MSRGLDIGIAADLRPAKDGRLANRAAAEAALGDRAAVQVAGGVGPDDRFEEYDSPDTIEAISAALRARGHRPRFVGSGRAFVESVLARRPDLVFNLAEGPLGSSATRSREAHVPAVCEMLRLPFTGSDPLTLSVALDKAVAKRLVASFGVATPRFALVESLEDAAQIDLPYPLFVKPVREGSSMGIRASSRVGDAQALEREVERLLDHYAEPVLVEEFCPGPEYTVAILGEGEGARAIGVMEVVPLASRIEDFAYTLEVKRDFRAQVEYHVPPRRPAKLVRAVEELALAAARALGCRDLCRVDVRTAADGTPRFLEANPLPGLAPGSGDVVILAGKCGIEYDELVHRVVEHALARARVCDAKFPCPTS